MKKVFEEASNELRLTGGKTIIFMDEIHRFTRAQQDVFLPFVENGTITLYFLTNSGFNGRIGATTENPSFKLTGALLSRCRVFVLAPLTADHVRSILQRADTVSCEDKGVKDIVSTEIIQYLSDLADSDGNSFSNKLLSL